MTSAIPAPAPDPRVPANLPRPRTRLAPTPSGFLHLGNAFSFLLAWAEARTQGGSIVLRIEDTDASRARPEFVEDIFASLEWLGIDWDDGPSGPGDAASAWRQSSPGRRARYGEVLERWIAEGQAYPCSCRRRELATAPQVGHLSEQAGFGRIYPGTCRGRAADSARLGDAWRLRLPDAPSRYEDIWRGGQELASLALAGDPVLRRADGCFSYHLAVCVDDADQGVDLVVRGRDLSPWAHLHGHLHRLLGSPAPRFAHHALLGGMDEERLAKSAGSLSLSTLRATGVSPEQVVGSLLPYLHAGRRAEALAAGDLLSLGRPRPIDGDARFPPAGTAPLWERSSGAAIGGDR